MNWEELLGSLGLHPGELPPSLTPEHYSHDSQKSITANEANIAKGEGLVVASMEPASASIESLPTDFNAYLHLLGTVGDEGLAGRYGAKVAGSLLLAAQACETCTTASVKRLKRRAYWNLYTEVILADYDAHVARWQALDHAPPQDDPDQLPLGYTEHHALVDRIAELYQLLDELAPDALAARPSP
jgi:hypothetical protein